MELVIFCLAIAYTLALPAEQKPLASASNSTFALYHIGRINNRDFYLDTTRVRHATARATCQSLGMELVRFTNEAEVIFVKNNLPRDTAPTRFWTGGVWIPSLTHFSWKIRNQLYPVQVSIPFIYYEKQYLTIDFHNYQNPSILVQVDSSATDYQTLCLLVRPQMVGAVAESVMIHNIHDYYDQSEDSHLETLNMIVGQHYPETEIQKPMALQYVGNINEKFFYVDKEVATPSPQTTMQAYCESLGMSLAKFDYADECQFVKDNHRPPTYRNLWTSAVWNKSLSHFRWETGSAGFIPIDSSLVSFELIPTYGSNLALAVELNATQTSISMISEYHSLYPLCMA